jgi:hypothetical protein
MFAVAAALIVATAQPVALTVSPARAVLLAPASRTLHLGNLGTERMAVDVAWKSLGPRTGPNRWLTIAPRRLVLRGGARTVLTVRAGPGASPGDHPVLVLVRGRPLDGSRVPVQLRLGVRLRIRAPGRLVRRLAVEGLRARRLKGRRTLVVSVANRGNVTEQLHGRLTVTLASHRRVISRLRFGRFRELFPGARASIALPYAGHARGLLTAFVGIRGSPSVRRYRLRL